MVDISAIIRYDGTTKRPGPVWRNFGSPPCTAIDSARLGSEEMNLLNNQK